MLKVLLDSTYLLPTFGIDVEGISNRDLEAMRKLGYSKVKYYCLSVVWVEIIGKVFKESLKRNIKLDSIIDVAVDSLMRSRFYQWIDPPPEAIILAYKMRKEGHGDIIDNLLYGTAIVQKMIFLTMDKTLIDFLRSNNYDTENVFDHNKLIQLLSD